MRSTLTAMISSEAITIEDIHAARDAFIELKLSTEIVGMILNFAEYWCTEHFNLHVPLSIGRGLAQNKLTEYNDRARFNEASALYLQTDPLGQGEDFDDVEILTPKRVVFRVVSRDEGENMEPGRQGTFLNNMSWLDASILREDETWTGAERMEPKICLLYTSDAAD